MEKNKRANKKAPTSRDLAQLLGVSQATISRAFSTKNAGSVKEELREKIYQKAKEIGYHPNLLARSMIVGRSDLVALVVGEGIGLFYQTLILDLTQALQKSGKQCLIFKLNSRETVAQIITRVMQFQVDSIIITASAVTPEMEQACVDLHVPVVLFNRTSTALSGVYTNSYRGGKMAAEHLVGKGHRHIAYICYSYATQEEREKKAGFTRVLANNGLQISAELKADYTYQAGYEAAKALFKNKGDTTAVFCSSDMIAIGFTDYVRYGLGLLPGVDFSIMGYDDIHVLNWQAYPLDTIRQPTHTLVEATVALLLSLTEELAGIHHREVELALVTRGSVATLL